MNALPEDARWQACLSAYQLDRFRMGELSAAEQRNVEAHLEGCARCRAAIAFLASEEGAFRALATPLRHPRRAVGPTLALGAAAAVCLLALWPTSGVRSKGPAVSVSMYVQHGTSVRRALPGEVVAPGDSVRFTYSSRAPATVAVLSLDGAGVATVYFPAGQETVPLPAAEDAPLPLATQLDGVLGEEKVVALFCE
jgi:anti-sigma factor RsiW